MHPCKIKNVNLLKKNAIQILTFELYCMYSSWCIVSLDNTQPYFIVTCVSMER